jgi:ATP-dependent DNA ligase I
VLLHDVVQTSRRVTETSGRLAKIELVADLLKRAGPEELETAIAFLSGAPRQGRLGIGYATLQAARPEHAAAAPTLELALVDATLQRLAHTSGKGAAQAKARLLGELFVRGTPDEQEFLSRLVMGELRQGALEGLVTAAVARAAGLDPDAVRRATMLAADLGRVAHAALTQGASGLAGFKVQLFRPLQPMLAQPADDVSDALTRLGGEAAFEYKLDGARIQVHKAGDEVRVFSRQLNDVTPSVPEVVDAVRRLSLADTILDGEAIALRRDGAPLPFQVTMRRFGRKLDVARMRAELPLASFFFDILYADGASLVDQPYVQRFAALAGAVPAERRVPRIVTTDAGQAAAFFERAIAAGQEGLMAKALDARYDAGARGAAWLKLKPAHTLDLVVLAAEWGHGRRHGRLSNLHLGARDSETGGFVMLGKTFKGMTDEMLEWQTAKLLELETRRDTYVVYVRPELVVEVAFNGIQASPQYPGGLALRFARVVRYRPDKRPDQSDTIETVRALYRRGVGRAGD